MDSDGDRAITSVKDLTNEMRDALIFLFAKGYTAKYIRQTLLAQFATHVSDQVLLQGAVLYDGDIDSLRTELARHAITTGLARKEERLARLSELAESWEAGAQENIKAATVYLKVMDQIREETEPLGLKLLVISEDPWYQLLAELRGQSLSSLATDRSLPATSVVDLPPDQMRTLSDESSNDSE